VTTVQTPSALTPDVQATLRRALAEDLGAGDLTSQAVVPADAQAQARFLAKEAGVVAGLPFAEAIFRELDPSCTFEVTIPDGAQVEAGAYVAEVRGQARALLTGERTALNLVQRLSGIATRTRAAVEVLRGTRIRLLDTRKTTPGMRALEKYAVRQGGGSNHRLGLYDAVLIKNNHLKFASPAEAIRRARASAPVTATVEVEVESIEQLHDALTAAPDIILLDNMPLERLQEAIALIAGRARIEVSGNVTLETLPRLAGLEVDYISMGALTHSAVALDFSLRFEVLSR
jgi:nicotinate-nucleotide pyrophosphorylase (carboxylating)